MLISRMLFCYYWYRKGTFFANGMRMLKTILWVYIIEQTMSHINMDDQFTSCRLPYSRTICSMLLLVVLFVNPEETTTNYRAKSC